MFKSISWKEISGVLIFILVFTFLHYTNDNTLVRKTGLIAICFMAFYQILINPIVILSRTRSSSRLKYLGIITEMTPSTDRSYRTLITIDYKHEFKTKFIQLSRHNANLTRLHVGDKVVVIMNYKNVNKSILIDKYYYLYELVLPMLGGLAFLVYLLFHYASILGLPS